MFSEDIDVLLRWAWIVIAVFFFLTEIFTAGFVLFCFGIGAVVAALAAFLGAGLALQIGIFIVVSIVAVVLARPFADRVSRPGVQQIAGNRMIGKGGVVLQTIDPIANTGIVRVESESWRAESLDGEQFEVGETVEVLSVEGVRLQVRAKAGRVDSARAETDEQTESAA